MVKWYDPVKGFGFLAPADGSRDRFCHVSSVSRAGWDTLPEGASITCEVEQGWRGPQVWRILAVHASTASAGGEVRDGLRRERRDRRWGRDAAVGPAGERLGLVKFYNATKGYGFVVQDGGGPDVFVHGSVLGRAGLRVLEAGQRASGPA